VSILYISEFTILCLNYTGLVFFLIDQRMMQLHHIFWQSAGNYFSLQNCRFKMIFQVLEYRESEYRNFNLLSEFLVCVLSKNGLI